MPRPTARSTCLTRHGDPRVRYVRYEQNRGACYARNLGAQHARGSILAFQDSDDHWHADKLQKQYDLLMATGADLCYCGMNRVAASGSSFYYPVHAPRPGRALEDFLGREPRQHADHAHAPRRLGSCALRRGHPPLSGLGFRHSRGRTLPARVSAGGAGRVRGRRRQHLRRRQVLPPPAAPV
ncbi:MAG: glycosyltransferase family 2 protein [Oscillospiraceae bacterium]